jgi:formate dehydrogenase beta subunit
VRYLPARVGPDWWDRNISCRQGCPVRTNAGRYVALIADGDLETSYRYASLPNPFASICGRICAAPCEDACRRGIVDAPIAIRALKRVVCERYGVESHLGEEVYRELRPARPQGRGRVAVIGAGPAGLSCAHDLALAGYEVTVFEKDTRLGGMIDMGVPEYRLPREVLRREIEAILNLGVEVRTGVALTRDYGIAELKAEGYEAIFIAVGAMRSRSLEIEGVDLDGVFKAVEFLLNVNRGFHVELGRKVVVIGGGNVALESREEMPAHEFEIAEAELEGVKILHRLGPKRILGKEGRVRGLETLKVASVFDPDGRFNPRFVPGTEEVIECDSVILAIGQTPDTSFLRPEDGVAVTPRGTIQVDPETLATTAPGVFAGGDVAFGPRNLIDAVADGRRAAASIVRYLEGEAEKRPRGRLFQVPPLERPRDYDSRPRVPVPSLPVERRIGIREVELGYDVPLAEREAERCLRCYLNIVLDPDLCILCGLCVDICPTGVIKIVPAEEVEGALREVPEGAAWDEPPGKFGRSAMLIDEAACIRCALCVLRCPPGALYMVEWEGEEVFRLAELSRERSLQLEPAGTRGRERERG